MPMTQEDIHAHYQETWSARAAADDADALRYSNEVEDGVIYPAYEELLRDSNVSVDGGRVLDVGAGAGRWVRFFMDRFAPKHITAIDFTPASIELLKASCKSASVDLDFKVADVTAHSVELGEFDLVNVANVLFHIPEPDRFQRALHNLAGCLREGGAIVSTEYMPRCSMRTEWMMVRSRYEMEAAAAAAGLTICAVRASSFFANDPMGLDGPDNGTRKLFNTVRAESQALLGSNMDARSRDFIVRLLVDVERALGFARERTAEIDCPSQKLVLMRKAAPSS